MTPDFDVENPGVIDWRYFVMLCPPGWAWFEHTRKCYIIVMEKKSNEQANEYCKAISHDNKVRIQEVFLK